MVISSIYKTIKFLVYCVLNFWYVLRPAFWVIHALNHFFIVYKIPSKVFETPRLTRMHFGTPWMKIEAIVIIICTVDLSGSHLAWGHTWIWAEEATLCSSFDCRRCIINMVIFGVGSVKKLVQHLWKSSALTVRDVMSSWQEDFMDLSLYEWKLQGDWRFYHKRWGCYLDSSIWNMPTRCVMLTWHCIWQTYHPMDKDQ